jgi:hypothetical protein
VFVAQAFDVQCRINSADGEYFIKQKKRIENLTGSAGTLYLCQGFGFFVLRLFCVL